MKVSISISLDSKPAQLSMSANRKVKVGEKVRASSALKEFLAKGGTLTKQGKFSQSDAAFSIDLPSGNNILLPAFVVDVD